MIRQKLILASSSPRRKFLLEQIEADFTCSPVDILEFIEFPDDPCASAEAIARNKANAARGFIRESEVILAADTIVALDGMIIGKPQSKENAISILKQLAAKTHLVVTGVCLMSKAKTQSFHVVTQVTMGDLTDDEILYYLNNWNHMDKAGAYGIQDWIGWTKITRIEGSYSNVMGLPVAEVYRALKDFNPIS